MVQCSVDIENTGNCSGSEVAQLYVGFNNSKIDRPVKILRGFKKVALQPHEKRTIIFDVYSADLAYYDATAKFWKVENMTHEIYMGNSSSPLSLQKASFITSGF